MNSWLWTSRGPLILREKHIIFVWSIWFLYIHKGYFKTLFHIWTLPYITFCRWTFFSLFYQGKESYRRELLCPPIICMSACTWTLLIFIFLHFCHNIGPAYPSSWGQTPNSSFRQHNLPLFQDLCIQETLIIVCSFSLLFSTFISQISDLPQLLYTLSSFSLKEK